MSTGAVGRDRVSRGVLSPPSARIWRGASEASRQITCSDPPSHGRFDLRRNAHGIEAEIETRHGLGS